MPEYLFKNSVDVVTPMSYHPGYAMYYLTRCVTGWFRVSGAPWTKGY